MLKVKADKRLLLLILLFLFVFTLMLVAVLYFILSTRILFFAVLILSAAFLASSVWITSYFLSTFYEKGEDCIKITSGVIIKKYTCISIGAPFVAVRYKLPFKTGFTVVFVYGGSQIILSTKVV